MGTIAPQRSSGRSSPARDMARGARSAERSRTFAQNHRGVANPRSRGRIRGGRFVSGFVGEQFALPQALEALRTVRRNQPKAEERLRISAADPLNLIGIILPGGRIRPASTRVLDFRNGLLLEDSQTQPADSREHASLASGRAGLTKE